MNTTDWERLHEHLSRARALSRALELCNFEDDERGLIHAMMDEQLNAARNTLEANHAA